MPLPPNRVDYLPMIDRPTIKWPANARVAFWVAPNIEHYEYLPLLDGVRNPWPRTPCPMCNSTQRVRQSRGLARDRGARPLPDPVLDHLNIGVLQHFPDIADAMLKRDWTL